MTKTIWKPHVTVAAVLEQEGRFLLVEEQVGDQIRFNQPAGHLEEGESLVTAVAREALEETGRDFHPEYVTGVYQWKSPLNGVTYLRVAFTGGYSAQDSGRALDTGIIATHWLSRAEVEALGEQLRSPMVLQCIDDYLSGARYPLALIRDL